MLFPHPAHHPHWWTDSHRSAQVNLRLGASLSFVAGAINAGGFLAVGQYTSHMTGMLSSITDHLALGELRLALAGLVALLAFVGGAVTTAWMVNWSLRRQLRSAFARPLVVEAGLLLVFGLFGAAINLSSGLFIPLTVLLLCFIMGLQNALITKISNAEIRTTHVTGLVTDIGIELGKLLYFNGADAPTKIVANRRKLRIHLTLVGCFFIGGVVGAVGFKTWGYVTSVPLALLLAVLFWGPVLHDIRSGRIAPRLPQTYR
ncbi:YoaK family protein [Candidatus Skiveiella danica]|jgi:uncharacterized membrane protein YoaK (UPF0700 family)|uniref:YoaK family protein n=1 Tax=Candidatus Skiveiella danica TaxID=3386177 RepID=UPI0009D45724|nr:DUF1275 domain-containing protein [Comamonadaceae bacterium]MBK9198470.1 DUF1275 domain-containing protein [Betaproteobacteria bacterium]MBP8100265.1 DUF1275 domain-containing protein [Burkholderiaceae bacterium]OQC10238.1 MAG: hypothetical protein BWX79_01348 [Alphaproteobacteria bacterium ADurb.Bin100]MBK6558362.1 DUF1275 domain-containing protein [Comamonadaceae bacterium]